MATRCSLAPPASPAGSERIRGRHTRFRRTPAGESDAMNSSAVGPVRLADALGWGSSLLGAPMNLAPRRLLRPIGPEGDGTPVAGPRPAGVREPPPTRNSVPNRQRRIGMWSRVAGDTMDLALLVQARRHKCRDAD